MSKRILIVDDEPQIGDVLSGYLVREGFDTVVKMNVADAMVAIREYEPEMLILDITLPDGSGLDVLRSVAAERQVPTIMLTARSDEVDRIIGLELGADDYISKPFSPREVVARVRALFRRADKRDAASTAPKPREQHLRVRDLDMNLTAHEVRMRDEPILLTPSEFRILQILAENAGQVFSRAQLLDLSHDEGSIYERTLDRHINNLRKKVEPDPDDPSYIVTVYGVGYKLKRE